LEVGLIGRNNDLIGQILEIFWGEKKNEKKKDSVKQIVDEQGYSRSVEERAVKLTSGTTKLMAISSQARRSKIWGLVKKGLC